MQIVVIALWYDKKLLSIAIAKPICNDLTLHLSLVQTLFNNLLHWLSVKYPYSASPLKALLPLVPLKVLLIKLLSPIFPLLLFDCPCDPWNLCVLVLVTHATDLILLMECSVLLLKKIRQFQEFLCTIWTFSLHKLSKYCIFYLRGILNESLKVSIQLLKLQNLDHI